MDDILNPDQQMIPIFLEATMGRVFKLPSRAASQRCPLQLWLKPQEKPDPMGLTVPPEGFMGYLLIVVSALESA
jgi:hypothetical protein